MLSKHKLFTAFGFLWNLNYLLGAFGFEVKGVFIIYIVLLLLVFLINGDGKVTLNKWTGILLLLVFLLPILFVKSVSISEYSQYKTIFFLLKCGPIVLFPLFLKEYIMSFIKGYWIACFIFLCIVAMKSIPFIADASVNNRFQIGLLNPIWISRFIMEGLLITIIVLKKKRIVFYYLLLSLPVFYVCGSKGPFLAGIFSFITYLFFNKKIFKQKAIILVSVFLLGFMVPKVLDFSDGSYITQRFLRAVPDKASKSLIEESRVVVWPTSLLKLRDVSVQKLLFGHGFGRYGDFYYNNTTFRFYPHNLLLELLIECGIIYLIIFFLYILSFHSVNVFSYLFYFSFFNAMFSGDILLNESIFLYLSLTFAYKVYLKKTSRDITIQQPI